MWRRDLVVLALWLSSPVEPWLWGQISSPTSTVVRVPATANPYLAGMPNGTKASLEDAAPRQSPVLVNLSLVDAVAVSFVASGGTNHVPSCPPHCYPPDGSSLLAGHGSENGISDATFPYSSLLGVFLDNDQPNGTHAPRGLGFGSIGTDLLSLSPKLKQVFFIGTGTTKQGVARRYLIPKGATRLFLGVMDGYGWNNNSGSLQVMAVLEHSEISSSIFTTDSTISYASWPCLPDRSRCTPGQEIVEAKGPGRYHVLLPAQLEWAVSIPVPVGAIVTVSGATGIVCLDFRLQGPASCSGPQGSGAPAGDGFLVPEEPAGALVSRRAGDRTYFSVNGRGGAAFQHQDGYFEFDVAIHEVR
jgi:hypothetical protein